MSSIKINEITFNCPAENVAQIFMITADIIASGEHAHLVIESEVDGKKVKNLVHITPSTKVSAVLDDLDSLASKAFEPNIQLLWADFTAKQDAERVAELEAAKDA